MADEDHQNDKPLAHLAEVERGDEPQPVEQDNADPAPPNAAQRLRAFEDEHLGEDTPRFAGKVEKGHGSIFMRKKADGGKLSDEARAEHAALERLIDAEDELSKATAALAVAQNKHADAAAAVDRTAEAHSKAKQKAAVDGDE